MNADCHLVYFTKGRRALRDGIARETLASLWVLDSGEYAAAEAGWCYEAAPVVRVDYVEIERHILELIPDLDTGASFAKMYGTQK